MGSETLQEELVLPSGRLLVATHDVRDKSDLVLLAPERLKALLDVLTTRHGHTVLALRLIGKWDIPMATETQSICIEGGTLQLGDFDTIERLRRERRVEAETQKICKPDAVHPYVILGGTVAGNALIVQTGDGNDWYDIQTATNSAGEYSLVVKFLSDTEAAQLINS